MVVPRGILERVRISVVGALKAAREIPVPTVLGVRARIKVDDVGARVQPHRVDLVPPFDRVRGIGDGEPPDVQVLGRSLPHPSPLLPDDRSEHLGVLGHDEVAKVLGVYVVGQPEVAGGEQMLEILRRNQRPGDGRHRFVREADPRSRSVICLGVWVLVHAAVAWDADVSHQWGDHDIFKQSGRRRVQPRES